MTDSQTAATDAIVVSYRSAETMAAAVAAARSCRRVGRIVVVDNSPGDGSAEAALNAGATVVVSSEGNIGFAAAVNAGVRLSDSEMVLLLNPDAFLNETALDLLIDALSRRTATVIAAPALVDDHTGDVMLGARRFSTWWNRSVFAMPVLRRIRRFKPEYQDEERLLRMTSPVAVDYVWGAVMLVRRSFLDAVGGLDERFFMYSEDEDLCRRAAAEGRQVMVVPQARVRHVGGASSVDLRHCVQARIAYANWQLLDKWDGRRRALLFGSVVEIVCAARVLASALLRDRQRREASLQTLLTLRRFFRRSSSCPD